MMRLFGVYRQRWPRFVGGVVGEEHYEAVVERCGTVMAQYGGEAIREGKKLGVLAPIVVREI